MGKVILIGGSLAAGKSTLARRLSKEKKIIALIKDEIKEILVDEIDYKTREENKLISNATMKTIFYLVEKYMVIDGSIIIEANFHENELLYLKELIEKYHYDHVYFKIIGDFKILYERFINRITNEKRHRAHLSAGLEDYDKFIKYCSEYNNENYFYDVISLDSTKMSFEEIYKEILKYI